MDSLNAGLAAAGGYVQQSDIRGGAGSAGRYGSIVLRVPADKLNGFLEALAPHGTVLARTENVQDVTMDYVDVQSRLKALRTHLSKLPQLSSCAALQRIVKYMGYGDYLSGQGGDKSRVELLLALARQEPGVEGFLRRLEALRDTVETGGGDPACPFVLSTIHASKGLEYDRVFLIDAVDGIFPSVNPRKGNDLSDEERVALEEERRLFYVGATRARRQLVLLTCDNRFGEPSPPASFVGQFLGTPEWASQRPGTPGKAPAEPDAAAVAAWEKDYLPGTAVVHRAFGPGMVVSRSGAVAVIAFDEVGTKKVELTACLRKRLLRLASAPDF